MTLNSSNFISSFEEIQKYQCIIQFFEYPRLVSLFLYCSGNYDIFVDGKKYGSYNDSGSFGELALMYNQPRAATIVATSSGIVWALVGLGFAHRTHNLDNNS